MRLLQSSGWPLRLRSAGGYRCPEKQKSHELLGGKALTSIYCWTCIPSEEESSFINSHHGGCLRAQSGEGDTSRVVHGSMEDTENADIKSIVPGGVGSRRGCTGAPGELPALWREDEQQQRIQGVRMGEKKETGGGKEVGKGGQAR